MTNRTVITPAAGPAQAGEAAIRQIAAELERCTQATPQSGTSPRNAGATSSANRVSDERASG